MKENQSTESILDPWIPFASNSGAKLSIEKMMTERAYDELVRDHGEGLFSKDHYGTRAKLELSYSRFIVTARIEECAFGNFIANFDANFRAKQRFALSVTTNNMMPQVFSRRALLKYHPKARLHESIDNWDKHLCGEIVCDKYLFEVRKLDKAYNSKLSNNAKVVLASERIQKVLSKLAKGNLWIWARGIPGSEVLSSNGIGAFLVVKPQSTLPLNDMFVVINHLIEELEVAGLIGKLEAFEC